MKDNKNKTDELLVELEKQLELKNKKLMMSMWTLLITSSCFYIMIIVLLIIILKDEILFGIIAGLSTIMFLIAGFISLKFEVDAGYYECRKCHNKFIPTYFDVLLAPHMVTTRYLKCPKCNKRTWSKKIMV